MKLDILVSRVGSVKLMEILKRKQKVSSVSGSTVAGYLLLGMGKQSHYTLNTVTPFSRVMAFPAVYETLSPTEISIEIGSQNVNKFHADSG